MTLKSVPRMWPVALSLFTCLPSGCPAEADALGADSASVTLAVPYRTVLANELIRFTVRLRNESKDRLPYIADSYDAAGKQVFISVERGVRNFEETFRTDSRPGLGRPAILRIERDGKWDVVAKEAKVVLLPGQTVEWNGSRFDPTLFYIALGSPKSIQAHVLIGPGRWVSSKSVPIKLIDRDLSSSAVTFQGFYVRGQMKTRYPMKVHRVDIEGKEYLFDSSGGRICEVPKGATPESAWDPETAVFAVRFPGLDVPPIRYSITEMQVVPVQPEGASRRP